MNRRELLAVIGGAAALAPFGATAQPGRPVIGYLSQRSAEAETPLRTGFLEGLEQRSFVVGRNVAIEYRFSEGSVDRLPSLAAELIGLPAALLVATDLLSAVTAKKAAAVIPIVFFGAGGDPVSWARYPPTTRSDRLSRRSCGASAAAPSPCGGSSSQGGRTAHPGSVRPQRG